MLISNAVMGGEAGVALQWAERLRSFPIMLPIADSGSSADWTTLPLVQVCMCECMCGSYIV